MNNHFTSADYTPHFSGHESFHLRYGWLKKACDEIEVALAEDRDTIKVFTDDDAIARFGVGKNMVAAIRYWATSCGALNNKAGKIEIGALGEQLLASKGLDPYLENPCSLWLLHWELASNLKRTLYFWFFNFFNERTFDKKKIEKKFFAFADQSAWKKLNRPTIEKDLAVLLNTYSMGTLQKKGSQEDSLTSPLAELGLIRHGTESGNMGLGWGAKPSLGNGVFLYALLDFWDKSSSANTLNFQTILLDEGSPGRIFLMDENDLAIRLMGLEELTGGKLSWSETAGMRQVVRTEKISKAAAWAYAVADFASSKKKAA